MKFTHPIVFPELLDQPENGSPAWFARAHEYAVLCQMAYTSTLVVCPACNWSHEPKAPMTACLSCGGGLATVEFGEHERGAVLEALCRLKVRMAANSGGGIVLA